MEVLDMLAGTFAIVGGTAVSAFFWWCHIILTDYDEYYRSTLT